MSRKTNLNHNITGVILSGGAGSRFGGLDKGLQSYKGKALIEHVIQRLSGQVDDLILCVNRNHEQYQKYGYQLVKDQAQIQQSIQTASNYQGPMAGIVSAVKTLTKTKHPGSQSMLISSCDSPMLPPDYVTKLNTMMLNNNASSAVVHDGERSQNLHCLIHSSAWPSITAFYENGERAMYKWHKKNGSVEVDFSNQAAYFLNINSTDMLN